MKKIMAVILMMVGIALMFMIPSEEATLSEFVWQFVYTKIPGAALLAIAYRLNPSKA